MRKSLFFLTFLFIASSCNQSRELKNKNKLYIVTTTQMIRDAVANIVGEHAEVISLMGPGVDPHLYKATQGDLQKLTKADIIFYNGLHLEGKMQDIFQRMSKTKEVIAVASQIPEDELLTITKPGQEKAHDPHIWHSIALWIKILDPILETLNKQLPSSKIQFKNNTEAYTAKLKIVDADIKEQIKSIPEKQRLLITSHDAFNYYGREYGIDVKGLQGISTVSEVGIRDVTDMVDEIVKRNVKAVFVESSVPKKPLQAVIEGCQQKGHQVRIGGTLYSDAMGNEGSAEGTYIGMIKFNTQTIYNALK